MEEVTSETQRLVYGELADHPAEWGDAERIAVRIADIHDVSGFSGADWVWETLAVLEAEGRLPMANGQQKFRKCL